MTGSSWWLAADPVGDAVVWALTRVHAGQAPSGPVGAGMAEGLGWARELVGSALPREGALWDGPLADPSAERELAERLGDALLPRVLREGLSGAEPDRPDTLTVAVRGWLARVPWDALVLDRHGTRLVEVTRVLGGLPATLHVGRSRQPDPDATGGAVRIVDPGPAEAAGNRDAVAPLYPAGRPPDWDALCTGDERIVSAGAGGGVTVTRFGSVLRRRRPARLTYFGHATSGQDHAPASAALIFADDADAAAPFTAFEWLADPDTFPAPPRVAIIGCGSDDSGLLEQSGLPIAAINAGAALVTATRWILPLDPSTTDRPTTALAVEVDRAHGGADPVGGQRAWQLDRLAQWRRDGSRAASPLLWAALVSYLAPGRG